MSAEIFWEVFTLHTGVGLAHDNMAIWYRKGHWINSDFISVLHSKHTQLKTLGISIDAY